jgi:hypothetical protein
MSDYAHNVMRELLASPTEPEFNSTIIPILSMEPLIRTLIKREIVDTREEAIETINCMISEVEGGEDIRDVLELYDLNLDDAVDLILCGIKPFESKERSKWGSDSPFHI